ncbi:AAA family ATPase [uncultured Bradyrhizobium sp.]|jgi:predicted ATPase|uniref:AAA family ATPase n=1 Tax=uncultured Bradyrhizobium sp. TaxID=199684 RepID=UPI002616CA35|nr:AAA family ATPase [uncultured Bradyrhizobium sp.]
MSDERKEVQAELYARAAQVSLAFSTQPTRGDNEELWLRREALEREVSYQLGTTDQHLCIDGPSGTGKTSLVQKIFSNRSRDFMHVQLSKDMHWKDFCRQFVEIPRRTKVSREASAKGILNLFKFGGEFNFKYGDEFSEKDSYELQLKKAEQWGAHDVAKWVHDNKLVLVVDDFEVADEDTVGRIAAVCKLLGQSFEGKLVLVGTDDILKRLLKANPALTHRISEITVGGLANAGESVGYLNSKFDFLDIKTPASDRRLTRTEKLQYAEYIFDAANGLMKQLNWLGQHLVAKVGSGNRLTLPTVREVCRKIIADFRLENRDSIRNISRVIENNADFSDVFSFLVSRSVSSITRLSEIDEHLSGKYRADSIKSALEYLEESGIIVTTGVSEVRVFFKNPPLMNCIAAHLSHGADYGWEPRLDREMKGGLEQISLGLIGGKVRDRDPSG